MAKIKVDIDLVKFDALATEAKQKAAKPEPLSGKAETEAAMEYLHAKIMVLRTLKQPVPWTCKVDGVETLDGIAGLVAAVWRPSRGKPLSSHTIKAHTLRIAKQRAEAKAVAAAEAEKRQAEKSLAKSPPENPTPQPTPQPPTAPTTPKLFGSLMRPSSPKPQPPAATINDD